MPSGHSVLDAPASGPADSRSRNGFSRVAGAVAASLSRPGYPGNRRWSSRRHLPVRWPTGHSGRAERRQRSGVEQRDHRRQLRQWPPRRDALHHRPSRPSRAAASRRPSSMSAPVRTTRTSPSQSGRATSIGAQWSVPGRGRVTQRVRHRPVGREHPQRLGSPYRAGGHLRCTSRGLTLNGDGTNPAVTGEDVGNGLDLDDQHRRCQPSAAILLQHRWCGQPTDHLTDGEQPLHPGPRRRRRGRGGRAVGSPSPAARTPPGNNVTISNNDFRGFHRTWPERSRPMPSARPQRV